MAQRTLVGVLQVGTEGAVFFAGSVTFSLDDAVLIERLLSRVPGLVGGDLAFDHDAEITGEVQGSRVEHVTLLVVKTEEVDYHVKGSPLGTNLSLCQEAQRGRLLVYESGKPTFAADERTYSVDDQFVLERLFCGCIGSGEGGLVYDNNARIKGSFTECSVRRIELLIVETEEVDYHVKGASTSRQG